MLDVGQLQREVVTPALQAVGMWSLAAERLVIATAVHESHLVYLRQVGGGPALGLWQIEPATHRDIWKNWLAYRPDATAAIRAHALLPADVGPEPSDDLLIFNLRYAALICRCLYRRIKAPLPAAEDWRGLAEYWKRWYNTAAGRGTEAGFVASAVNAGLATV